MIHCKTLGSDVKSVLNIDALLIDATSAKKLLFNSAFSVIVVDTGVRSKNDDAKQNVIAIYEQGEGKVIIDKIGILTEEMIKLIFSVDIVNNPSFHQSSYKTTSYFTI